MVKAKVKKFSPRQVKKEKCKCGFSLFNLNIAFDDLYEQLLDTNPMGVSQIAAYMEDKALEVRKNCGISTSDLRKRFKRIRQSARDRNWKKAEEDLLNISYFLWDRMKACAD